MGRRWLTRKGNYILKSNLPIGVQNMTLKSIDDHSFSYIKVFHEEISIVCYADDIVDTEDDLQRLF